MARTKNTTNKSAIVETAVDDTTAVLNEVDDKNTEKKVQIADKKQLEDSDEIEVISLIPNVSYKDNRTNDYYEWESVGHSEFMTYETLKNMWRNSKGYFKNMWLKPLDDRVINKFGLTSTFEKYEFLMDKVNYTRPNIDKICENITATPIGLKYSICNKIRSMVVNGEITDIAVIKALEKHLNLDLTSFL